MGQEIERKFLARAEGWSAGRSFRLRQGYFDTRPGVSIRVRIRDDREAFLTIKGGAAERVRAEFEYPIPVEDAVALLDGFCAGRSLSKRRHEVPAGDLTWEVDVFEGALEGLVLAEIELPSADTPFSRPPWVGEEVTEDPRYGNYALAVDGRPPGNGREEA